MRFLIACMATAGLTACGQPPEPPMFAGRAILEGSLAEVDTGAVFVNVWNGPNDPMPALCRKYEIDDPAFHEEGGRLVLRFALDESHNMAGMGVPVGDDLDLEIRYDPDGAVDTKDGVESAWVAARPGDTAIEVSLRPYEAPVGDFFDGDDYPAGLRKRRR